MRRRVSSLVCSQRSKETFSILMMELGVGVVDAFIPPSTVSDRN